MIGLVLFLVGLWLLIAVVLGAKTESVNGHGLGGYLAAGFTRLFGGRWPVGALARFNAGGVA